MKQKRMGMAKVRRLVPPLAAGWDEWPWERFERRRRNAEKVLRKLNPWEENEARWVRGMIEAIDEIVAMKRKEWVALWRGAGI